jgi:hypothetical protein
MAGYPVLVIFFYLLTISSDTLFSVVQTKAGGRANGPGVHTGAVHHYGDRY